MRMNTIKHDGRINKKNAYYTSLIGVMIFFAFLHLFTTISFGDDTWFGVALDKYGFLGWLEMRYETWTSRLIIESIIITILKCPAFVWKSVDVLMMTLLYYDLVQLMGIQEDKKSSFYLAMLFCVYPFMHMGSAGWVATSVNYSWTLAIGLFAMIDLKRYIQGVKIKKYRYVVDLAALIMACNQELVVPIILVFCITGSVICRGKKQPAVYPGIGIVISLLSLIFIFTAPGNAVRKVEEIANCMPEFGVLSFIDKLRLITVSTLEHFVSIPNMIFFIFTLLIALIGMDDAKQKRRRIVSSLPLIVNIVFTIYFGITNIIINRNLNYTTPDIFIVNLKTGLLQYSMIAGLILIIVCSLLTLYWCLESKCHWLILSMILGLGLATRMALCISPTMFVSGTRTYFFMYMSMIIVNAYLINRLKTKWMYRMMNVLCGIGIIINIVMMCLFQTKY